jgi:hypothetical protein
MRRLAALALAAALAACGSAEGFKAHADSLVGQTKAAILSRFGPPSNAYSDTNAGVDMLTWNRASSDVLPGYMSCSRWSCFYVPASSYTVACSLTYTFTNNVAVSWRAEGNGCVAQMPKETK